MKGTCSITKNSKGEDIGKCIDVDENYPCFPSAGNCTAGTSCKYSPDWKHFWNSVKFSVPGLAALFGFNTSDAMPPHLCR